MARILVSGGAGFIGSHVVDLLVENFHNVMVVDDFSTGKMDNISHHSEEDVLKLCCDITDMRCLSMAFLAFKPTIVIHLAAQAAITTAMEDPMKDLAVNGIGTLNMLRMAEKHKVERFVYASTSAVYEEKRKIFAMKESIRLVPANEYGISKLAGESYVRISEIGSVILRFGNVYGPRQVPIGENQVIARMIRHFENGADFSIFGDGKQKRDFVFVGDVAEAVKIAATSGKPGIYNIASGKSRSVNEIARNLAEIYNVPMYPWSHDEARHDKRRSVRMNIRLAQEQLGWSPRVGLLEGLDKTAASFARVSTFEGLEDIINWENDE